MRTKRLILLAASISLLALWGCSSSMDSGGDNTKGNDLQEQIAASGFVGADKCINCHEGFSWSDEIVQGYLEGSHVIHDLDINADSAAACLECHDPIGDGPLIEGFINPLDVPPEGLAAVTCENCHGSGVDHYGIGPLPVASPDYTVCGKCHNEDYPHDNTEGVDIVELYEASKHAESGDRNDPRCVKCHTDEGGRLYKDVHTAAQLYAVALPLNGVISAIQCRTCHDPHNAGELQLGEGEVEREFSADDFDASAEYRTCTNCHQPHNAAIYTDPAILADLDDDDGPNGDLIYHGKRYNRVIANTHYDDPDTDDIIEGYAMDPENERVCRNCHNVHEARTAINVAWAESAHGGFIHATKEDAAAPSGDPIRRTYQDIFNVRTAGSESSWARGWPIDEEANCQRCHTATGAMNFLNGPTAYYPAVDAFIDYWDFLYDGGDPAPVAVNPNDFSYLEGTTEDVVGQSELLFCWTCHTDNVGGLRNPGAVTLQDRARVLYGPIPDVGKSNVCVGCHGGRANGEYVRNTPAASRSSSSRLHYLPAASALYAEVTHTAYEFDIDGDTNTAEHYTGAPLHAGIGRNLDSPETGSGPCVNCHMPDADHHFEAVEKDDLGVITAITNPTLCTDCHGGSMDVDALQTLSEQYQNLLAYLDSVTSGDNYVGTNFDSSSFIRGRGDSVSGKNDYGALQNDEFTRGHGGNWGYVHNAPYIRFIIFDTLDWMDNATFDGTITIPDDDGWDDAITWLGGNVDTGIVTRP